MLVANTTCSKISGCRGKITATIGLKVMMIHEAEVKEMVGLHLVQIQHLAMFIPRM